jgi:phosphoribosylformylglycinamidine (FGAM) synthase PurS component
VSEIDLVRKAKTKKIAKTKANRMLNSMEKNTVISQWSVQENSDAYAIRI